MKPTLYEVQTYTLCDGWVNCWTVYEEGDRDGKPQTFESEAAAQAELDGFLSDIQEQIDSGERAPDEGYDPEDFRVVEVAHA